MNLCVPISQLKQSSLSSVILRIFSLHSPAWWSFSFWRPSIIFLRPQFLRRSPLSVSDMPDNLWWSDVLYKKLHVVWSFGWGCLPPGAFLSLSQAAKGDALAVLGYVDPAVDWDDPKWALTFGRAGLFLVDSIFSVRSLSGSLTPLCPLKGPRRFTAFPSPLKHRKNHFRPFLKKGVSFQCPWDLHWAGHSPQLAGRELAGKAPSPLSKSVSWSDLPPGPTMLPFHSSSWRLTGH